MTQLEDYMHLPYLIVKSMAEDLTPEEQKELDDWLEESDGNRALYQRMTLREGRKDREEVIRALHKERGWQQFEASLPGYRRRIVWRRLNLVAAVLLPLLVGVFVFFQYRASQSSSVGESFVFGENLNDSLSGGVELITSDGNSVVLSSDSGHEVHIGENVVAKNGGSGLVYPQQASKGGEKDMNVLKTPRGGEYHVILSDGTEVFLNAATELYFPVVFNSEKREVFLVGEAYFKVAKDKERPFYVNTELARVKVYGTSFNVKAYASEKMKTLLVEGEVGVRGYADGKEYRMKPSELLSVGTDGKFEKVENVNPSLYAAWRQGCFVFLNENLEEILVTLERWYDVDFVYEVERLKSLHFTACMEKYEDLHFILNTITGIVGVKFIERDGVIVVE